MLTGGEEEKAKGTFTIPDGLASINSWIKKLFPQNKFFKKKVKNSIKPKKNKNRIK
jgi:hypothetical protein